MSDRVERMAVHGIECDLRPDPAWRGQWHCALHGVWFRDDEEPAACPAAELAIEVGDAALARVAELEAALENERIADGHYYETRGGVRCLRSIAPLEQRERALREVLGELAPLLRAIASLYDEHAAEASADKGAAKLPGRNWGYWLLPKVHDGIVSLRRAIDLLREGEP